MRCTRPVQLPPQLPVLRQKRIARLAVASGILLTETLETPLCFFHAVGLSISSVFASVKLSAR